LSPPDLDRLERNVSPSVLRLRHWAILLAIRLSCPYV
jgi:hypothetical protein